MGISMSPAFARIQMIPTRFWSLLAPPSLTPGCSSDRLFSIKWETFAPTRRRCSLAQTTSFSSRLPPLRENIQDRCDATIWQTINHFLVMRTREAAGREASPTAGVLDSQSVKTTEAAGPRGYDA